MGESFQCVGLSLCKHRAQYFPLNIDRFYLLLCTIITLIDNIMIDSLPPFFKCGTVHVVTNLYRTVTDDTA